MNKKRFQDIQAFLQTPSGLIIVGSICVLVGAIIFMQLGGKQQGFKPLQTLSGEKDYTAPYDIEHTTVSTIPPTASVANEVGVKVVDGDIVVIQNGQEKKITSWGHNSEALLSPDQTKIAYLSLSKESVEQKQNTGYPITSTNVWIISLDGTDATQVTTHENFVSRANLKWLDNDQLLFTNGQESVAVYTLSSAQTRSIFGPEKAVAMCMDACGFEERFLMSSDKRFLVHVYAEGGDTTKITILDTTALTPRTLSPQAFGAITNTVHFTSPTTLVFSAVTKDNKTISVTVDMETGSITKQ